LKIQREQTVERIFAEMNPHVDVANWLSTRVRGRARGILAANHPRWVAAYLESSRADVLELSTRPGKDVADRQRRFLCSAREASSSAMEAVGLNLL